MEMDDTYWMTSQSPTNTVCLSEISKVELRRDRKIGLLVHRQELVSQSEEKIIRQTGIKPGVIWQGRREWEQPITIMAQDTISGLEIPPSLKLYLLMVDEAHHAVAPGWIRTVERLNPEKLLGFTATPFRQDREPLSPQPFENRDKTGDPDGADRTQTPLPRSN